MAFPKFILHTLYYRTSTYQKSSPFCNYLYMPKAGNAEIIFCADDSTAAPRSDRILAPTPSRGGGLMWAWSGKGKPSLVLGCEQGAVRIHEGADGHSMV